MFDDSSETLPGMKDKVFTPKGMSLEVWVVRKGNEEISGVGYFNEKPSSRAQFFSELF
ncbi:hypothetical protein MSSD14B_08570 [Marinobacter salsuginis]|uniref:Uncharacterized protein n=1 Tax=Marinobacter salsuginis TaxID=418719 RepID=A0A5M3PWU8_9GAMM|nr:hypothetical protein MSSD14B_08570 [Marinobacter salsuginis]